MVESPTYYHSLSPVLRSLKEFDMESFPLQEEVVYARPTELPGYLKEATFHTSIVCSIKKASTTKPEDAEEKDSSEPSEASEEYLSIASEECEEDLSIAKEECEEGWGDTSDEYEGEDLDSDSHSSDEKSRRSSSSYSSSELKEILPDPWLEEKMDANSSRKEGHEEYKSIDRHLFMPFHCEIDQSEIDGVDLNDEPEEMDFIHFVSSILAQNLEHIVDIEESLHGPKASTSIEPQDTPSQGKLGGRMNVEYFLETFSSKSESSLEASQCDALVHALKNKLAIVQG